MSLCLLDQVVKKSSTRRLTKNFFPFFHDVVALFIFYFTLLTLYIMFNWNDLFTSKLVLAIFWMFVVFLKSKKERSKVFKSFFFILILKSKREGHWVNWTFGEHFLVLFLAKVKVADCFFFPKYFLD